MNISTTEILAIRTLDIGVRKFYASSLQECYAHWALTQLSNGISSYHLCILAGITWKDNYFESDALFLAALKELNIPVPSKESAIKNFAIDICKRILDKDISAEKGCDILVSISLETNDENYNDWYNLKSNDNWGYLSQEAYKSRLNKEIKKRAQSFLRQHNK